ncbi:30S ribosomal protein S9 [Paludisphaera borealis]|uniref:Small ribosomal subunit protein uS9 n=1 Tax=Paludisphaera borealis TaxID=1387353 RepID=A0A1U7CYM0_9BACT|nr:30S ribosomal protein S9 [Paludisphaera borealis]APW64052.1 30S ribosomal protein S9 [Paludisphaera borealis]MDR3622402.1 30S ribosomal protein S9 [Paludisphaera borealis]
MSATAQKTFTWGTGRRKTAVARVRIKDGTGQFIVNGLDAKEYFPLEVWLTDIHAPLKATEMTERVDVFVNVDGSGKSSQSGAVVMGLARALKAHRTDLDQALRDGGYLTRDARMVERKKFGHKKARKSFQFSKR